MIAIGDNQGIFQAQHGELPGVKGAGGQAKMFPLPPSQADASSVVSSALAYDPDVVEIESPSQCVAILTALKSLGNTKPIMSIDPCSAPPVIKATAGAANGMYWFQPFEDLFASNSADATLAKAIIGKYASPKMPIDSPALAGLATVMNVWTTFHTTPVAKLTSSYMLSTLKSGSNHPNFLANPYTCDGKAIPSEPAICNAGQKLYQIKNGQPVLDLTPVPIWPASSTPADRARPRRRGFRLPPPAPGAPDPAPMTDSAVGGTDDSVHAAVRGGFRWCVGSAEGRKTALLGKGGVRYRLGGMQTPISSGRRAGDGS